jgi:hypothetical protein
MFALSEILSKPDRTAIADTALLLQDLERPDLAEVLKWPFCVGEIRQMVLSELEKKTGLTFGGDVWKFVEQAPGLGIHNINEPPKRPIIEDALAELQPPRK